MSNLTPVKRLDRNGKLVTRHVKAGTEVGQVKNMPAPVDPSTPSSQEVTQDELLRGLSVVASRVKVTPDIEKNLKVIAEHVPEGFREVIEDFSTADDYKAKLWGYVLNYAPKDSKRFSMALLIELHVMETVVKLHPDPVPKGKYLVGDTTRGRELMVTANLSMSGYRKPKTAGQRKAVILALWAQRFETSDRIDLYEEIDNIDYIAQNFDAVMEHRHAIRERGSIDRGVIELIINNASPAMADGVL